jgi:cytolysin (calcineurin-like family phosphatase)
VEKVAGAGRLAPEQPQGIDHQNLRAIHHMNAIAGRRYPRILGGRVGKPQALLVAGDLTEDGKPSEWRRFARYYGKTGRDGLLRMPVYAGIGNHDFNYGDYVVRQLGERHGGLYYSWQMEDLHLVCLGEAPGSKELDWLRKDLARTGRELPVLLFFHYPLDGPFADNNWFGAGEYRDELAEVLDGFNVVAIFHGHFHASGNYRWRGYDVYNVGSPKYLHLSFAVVHITDEALRVSSWNYQYQRWWWWHQKPINGAQGVRELRQLEPLPDGTRPAVMPRHGCGAAPSCPPVPGPL